MKFFTLLLISLVAVCYAAEHEQEQDQELALDIDTQAFNLKDIFSKVKEVAEKIKAAAKANGEKLKEKLKEIASKIKAAAEKNADKLEEKLKEISAKVKNALEKIKAAAGPEAEKLKAKLKEIAEKIKECAEAKADKLEEKLKEISEKLKEATLDKVKDFVNNKRKEIADETIALAKETAAHCTKKTDITNEAVEALRTGDFLKQKVDDASKLFVQCYFEGLGFLKDGKPQLDVIAKRMGSILGPVKLISTMLKCGGLGGDNELDKTFNTYTCFFKNKAVILK